MASGIYMWTSPTCKSYVGQAFDLEERYKEFLDFNTSYAGDKIDKARNKYNHPSYWKYEILEYCSKDELDEREIYYIALYDTFKNGYNLTKGGKGAYGYKKSDEQKESFSEILRQLHADPNSSYNSEECRKKQSETHKRLRADPNSSYNSPEIYHKRHIYMTEKWQDDEFREKMLTLLHTPKIRLERSERMIKMRADPNSPYNSEEFRKKASESQKRLHADPNSIYNNEEYIRKHLDVCRSEEHIKKLRDSHSNPIVQLSIDNKFIREWISASEAQRETKNNEKFNVCSILRCCNGKQEKYKNYRWMKAEEYYSSLGKAM